MGCPIGETRSVGFSAAVDPRPRLRGEAMNTLSRDMTLRVCSRVDLTQLGSTRHNEAKTRARAVAQSEPHQL